MESFYVPQQSLLTNTPSYQLFKCIRSGQLIAAYQLPYETSQMLAGYLAMTSIIDTELTQFDDWISQACTLSHDMSNDLPTRAVFGLLGGMEEPMTSFLK